METKKNKKNPKKSKKKSDSPTIEVHPNKSPNKIDIAVSNNNNAININNSPKKEEKEEKIEKKDEKEEKEEKIDNIRNNIINDMAPLYEEMDNINSSNFGEFMPFFRPLKDDKSLLNDITSDPISSSLKKIEKGDDMDILTEIISLRDFLSMSSERIGYNPNIGKLLEEICKNLSKIYLPEIVIYSLQCINYIIDINPSLASILKKINAISSIMNTITSIEDITCVDHVIKIFEKISSSNYRLLLENKIFESFLVNIFDFLNIYQKKSIMIICYNITSRRINIEEYNMYIKPAMNVLINLISFDDNDERDNLFIVEKAVNIFYNIVNYLKSDIILNKEENKDDKNDNNNIVDDIINNYCVIENFAKILNNYFIKNSKITELIIQNILKTLVVILQISHQGIIKILENKFLDILSNIINNEFLSDTRNINNNNNIIININNNNSNNINQRNFSLNSIQYKKFSIFSKDFFEILTELFPSSISKDDDKKILKPENKAYYDNFCHNIFLPLINNVMKKSISIIHSNSFIKLLFSFINSVSKDDIIIFLPSKPISQIIIKLLNTKKNYQVKESISLIKTLLEKSPENYIVNFVREGIIDNLKNFKFEEEPKERRRKKYDFNNFDDFGLKLFPRFDKGLYRHERTRKKRKKYLLNLDKDNIDDKDKDKDKDKNKEIINEDNNNKDNKDKDTTIVQLEDKIKDLEKKLSIIQEKEKEKNEDSKNT